MEEGLKRELKDIQLKAVIQSDKFSPLLSEAVNDIKEQARSGNNEATVETAFDISLYGLLRDIGIKIYPKKEEPVETIRHVSKGRMDSQIGAVVIEFKHRSNLDTEDDINDATQQLSDYLDGLEEGSDEYYLGVVTDGTRIKFITRESGNEIEGTLHELTEKDLLRLIKNTISLETKALSADNLIEEFLHPPNNNLANSLVKTLYNSLKESPSQKTHMLHSEWERLFKLGHDDKSLQTKIEERGEKLSEIVDEEQLDMEGQYKVLFSLQTSYAIIVKLISYRVLSDVVFDGTIQSFKSLANSESEPLRSFFSEFENGAIFREIGLDNLLEGDFFSWYCSKEQWNEGIYEILRESIGRLSEYEDKSDIFNESEVSDLFRDFYQGMIPDVVRHTLGEYYTPTWLCQHLVENSTADKHDWEGLDPCAGSGTFLISMIDEVLSEIDDKEKDDEEILSEVTRRVKGVDLNPLAVLTARVNYFLAISEYFSQNIDYLEIPVYLGDSANIPEKVDVDSVTCISYKLDTQLDTLEITVPMSILDSSKEFSRTMLKLEEHVRFSDMEGGVDEILDIIPPEERKPQIEKNVEQLVDHLIDLEESDWDQIWTRIIKNFLKTASIGNFDVIVGNPPWIDWKNLPTNYRNQIKSLAINRHLFSGDSVTGGINLNICALITNVVAENYLSLDGTFAFLMPKPILFQQTYEGFRQLRLENKPCLHFQLLHDWSDAGDPFYPATQKFLTYYMGFEEPEDGIVPVKKFEKKRGTKIKEKQTSGLSEVMGLLSVKDRVAGQLQEDRTAYTLAEEKVDLNHFKKVSGECYYKGREGIEFYPQEVMLFLLDEEKPQPNGDAIWVKNYQNPRSKYSVPEKSMRLETNLLYPMIKGPEIKQFELERSGFIVPFPYKEENPRTPLSVDQMREESPLLLNHFTNSKEIIEQQTDYNERIEGKYATEFYSLARVGTYTYAPFKVAFRDNTKWCSTVVSTEDTEWGGEKMYLLQNHAPYISEKESDQYISEEEAHYICAIFNAPATEKYILQSSDSRTFKIRPPIHVPEFNPTNDKHTRLAELSKKAHDAPENKDEIRNEINEVYLRLCEESKNGSPADYKNASLDNYIEGHDG